MDRPKKILSCKIFSVGICTIYSILDTGCVTRDLTKILPVKLPIIALMAFVLCYSPQSLYVRNGKFWGLKNYWKDLSTLRKLKTKSGTCRLCCWCPTRHCYLIGSWKQQERCWTNLPYPFYLLSFFSLYILLVLLAKRLVGAATLLTLCKTGMGPADYKIVKNARRQWNNFDLMSRFN